MRASVNEYLEKKVFRVFLLFENTQKVFYGNRKRRRNAPYCARPKRKGLNAARTQPRDEHNGCRVAAERSEARSGALAPEAWRR